MGRIAWGPLPGDLLQTQASGSLPGLTSTGLTLDWVHPGFSPGHLSPASLPTSPVGHSPPLSLLRTSRLGVPSAWCTPSGCSSVRFTGHLRLHPAPHPRPLSQSLSHPFFILPTAPSSRVILFSARIWVLLCFPFPLKAVALSTLVPVSSAKRSA